MSSSGLLGYIDTLSGGSISKVGVFSLGIVPYINASILLQLLATAFPSLKKLQREEGPQGRARFILYQKLAALGFAIVQAVGQLSYIRPYVDDWSSEWLFSGVVALTAGSMILVHVADTITELKLGNGTSVLIFANIASALPTSVGAVFGSTIKHYVSVEVFTPVLDWQLLVLEFGFWVLFLARFYERPLPRLTFNVLNHENRYLRVIPTPYFFGMYFYGPDYYRSYGWHHFLP